MKKNVISLLSLIPFQRKSSIDWILPASIGLGLGVAAGVGVGMLLAPAPGADTRRQLKEGVGKVGEKARLLARRNHDEFNNVGHEANSFINDVGDIR